MNVEQEFVDEAGQVVRNQMTIVADGAPQAMQNGYVLTARWRGAHALDTLPQRTAKWSARAATRCLPTAGA